MRTPANADHLPRLPCELSGSRCPVPSRQQCIGRKSNTSVAGGWFTKNWCRIHEKVQTKFQKSTARHSMSLHHPALPYHVEGSKSGYTMGTPWMLPQNEGLTFGLRTALIPDISHVASDSRDDIISSTLQRMVGLRTQGTKTCR